MSNLDTIETHLAHNRVNEALRLGIDACRLPNCAEGDLYGLILAAKRAAKGQIALKAAQEWTRLYPQSATAWHNLGAELGDAGFSHDAIDAIDKAMDLGLMGPETFLVKARAIQSIGDFGTAEVYFREILRVSPTHLPSLRDLSQLLWMRDQDQDGALLIFPSVLTEDMAIIKSRLLSFMGRDQEALNTIQNAAMSGHSGAMIECARCLLALNQDDTAYQWAQSVHQALPYDKAAIDVLLELASALGFNQQVLDLAKLRMQIAPDDQYSIALLATAMRLIGDENYRKIYDYSGLVRAYLLPCPEGYPSLEDFLNALRQTILKLHGLKNHPVDQSLRHGSQTPMNLIHWQDPVIKAFFKSFETVIKQYLSDIGPGDDPVRARNQGRFQFHSSWSVRLRSGGFHTDHTHPEGWISSAFYLSVPPAMDNESEKPGWLKLGQPRFRTKPALGFESCLKPQEGLLALFPSHMWHGTIPFIEGYQRLSIASDIVPDDIWLNN